MNHTDKIPVAIYARVSSDDQAKGDSIEHQISQGMDYMHRYLGAEYYTDDSLIYKDEGISGYTTTLLDRPNIQRLLNDGRKNKFKVVIFKESSRVARDNEEFIKVPNILKNSGVRVVIPNTGYDSDNESTEIILPFSGLMAEQFSKTISVNVSSGYREKARKGQWATNVIPLGYQYNSETKRLEVDDDTADIIRMIFDMYVNKDIGAHTIALNLNEMGYKTKKGNPFHRAAIRETLSNQVYIGSVIYGKHRNKIDRVYDDNNNLVKKKRKLVSNTPIVVENAHPPIIEKSTFWKAQEIMKSRKIKSERNCNRKYPLTGILNCGVCGKGFITQIKNQKYRYYKCSSHHKFGIASCNNHLMYRAERIEQALLDDIKQYMTQLLNYSVVAQSNSTQDDSLSKKIESLTQKKKGLIKSQTDMFLKRDIFAEEAFDEAMISIKKQIEQIDEQIHILNQQVENHKSREIKMTTVQDILEDIDNITLDDEEALKILFNKVLEKVVIVDKDTIQEVHYKYHFVQN